MKTETTQHRWGYLLHGITGQRLEEGNYVVRHLTEAEARRVPASVAAQISVCPVTGQTSQIFISGNSYVVAF